MTPVPPSSAEAPSWTQRLVEQLQLISEVSETLTYRLLDLEERLSERERELAQLRDQAQASAELPAAVEGWLEQTDERLARVEELLRRGEGRGAAATLTAPRPLVAVTPPSSAAPGTAPEDEVPDFDPFPEEGEQAFLDEQIA